MIFGIGGIMRALLRRSIWRLALIAALLFGAGQVWAQSLLI
ncbi:MAG: hypothetical protein ACJASV_000373 [Pseudorhodobacter sp.]|jgi:hypothetical protein